MEDDGILYVPIPNLIRTSTENVKIGDELLIEDYFQRKTSLLYAVFNRHSITQKCILTMEIKFGTNARTVRFNCTLAHE